MTANIFIHAATDSISDITKGPLSGTMIALQSNISVRNWPTEAGSRALEGFIALEDATVVERLRKAGASIAGNLTMSELGLGLSGNISARAVSEGYADATLSADMMGEARIAAAAHRLIGFKPSYGIMSRFGFIGLIPSMECIGIIAKSPEVITDVLKAATGFDERDFSMSPDIPSFDSSDEIEPSATTIGTITQAHAFLAPAEEEIFKEALEALEDAGFMLKEISLEDFDLFRTVHHIVGSVEASSSGGKYDGVRFGHRAGAAKNWNDMYLKSRAESFGTVVKSFLFQGAYFQFEDYGTFEKACRIRAKLLKTVQTLFDTIDFLVLPQAVRSVPESETTAIDTLYDLCALTLPANVTGHPALCLPSKDGLSLQFIARHLRDGELLSLARYLVR
ncbi:MAG: amidase family protein [Syntrophales bacterium]|jgi:aspartyl-tRNA(Asn)/glutamyl-tRNA(Gln) amidotransferase subunit A|nr:amidase family protein [Syntrophales bacterium]MDY0045370.1 amidase family protein [Syntrophales bacterium]